MKLIIIIIGLILSAWVSFAVYTPVKEFSTGIQKVYLQTKTLQKNINNQSVGSVTTITDAYRELTRMFGIEVAQDTIKKEVLSTNNLAEKNIIDTLFSHDIALWISVGCGLLVLSVYANIMMILGFILKPLTMIL